MPTPLFQPGAQRMFEHERYIRSYSILASNIAMPYSCVYLNQQHKQQRASYILANLKLARSWRLISICCDATVRSISYLHYDACMQPYSQLDSSAPGLQLASCFQPGTIVALISSSCMDASKVASPIVRHLNFRTLRKAIWARDQTAAATAQSRVARPAAARRHQLQSHMTTSCTVQAFDHEDVDVPVCQLLALRCSSQHTSTARLPPR